MLVVSVWVLGVAVAAGAGLSSFWLMERPPPGWAWAASALHGLLAAAGAGLLVALVYGGAPDGQNFGHLASWFVVAALLGGAVIVVARLRRRRPSGLVVALHASVGLAGFVLLLAWRAIQH
jgi:hypothetical protein